MFVWFPPYRIKSDKQTSLEFSIQSACSLTLKQPNKAFNEALASAFTFHQRVEMDLSSVSDFTFLKIQSALHIWKKISPVFGDIIFEKPQRSDLLGRALRIRFHVPEDRNTSEKINTSFLRKQFGQTCTDVIQQDVSSVSDFTFHDISENSV